MSKALLDYKIEVEGRDEAEVAVYKDETSCGTIVQLAECLAEREEKRNEFSDRLRQLRDKLTRLKVGQEILEGREGGPNGSGRDSSENIFDLIRQRCLERKELAQSDLVLLNASRSKESEMKKLQLELVRARVELQASKQRDREEMNVQVQVQTKDQQIDILQLKLTERDRRIKRMGDELAESNRRLMEMEVRLELHDLKFVSYQKYSKEIDKHTLHQIHKDKLCQSSSQESESSSQKYTGKLVADLEKMEKMYISAKQDYAEKITKLEQEGSEYRTTIRTLENVIVAAQQQQQNETIDGTAELGPRAIEDCPDDEIESVAGKTGGLKISNYILTRMQLLETENAEYNQLVSTMNEKLEHSTDLLSKVVEKYERDTGVLSRKNGALEDKITALQTEMQSSAGEIAATEKNRQYHRLERNLDDYMAEISRLEERLSTKEKIISRLRFKSVEKRLANESSKAAAVQPNEADTKAD